MITKVFDKVKGQLIQVDQHLYELLMFPPEGNSDPVMPNDLDIEDLYLNFKSNEGEVGTKKKEAIIRNLYAISDMYLLKADILDELDKNYIEHGKELLRRYSDVLLKLIEKKAISKIKEYDIKKLFKKSKYKGFNQDEILFELMRESESHCTYISLHKKLSKDWKDDHPFLKKQNNELNFFYIGVLIGLIVAISNFCEEKHVHINSNDVLDIPNILFEIEGIPEKLLVIKHTGIYDMLLEKYKNKKATVATVIAQLIKPKDKDINDVARYIAGLLGGLEYSERTDNTPHTKKAIENAIKFLDSIGEDASVSQLQEVLMRIYK